MMTSIPSSKQGQALFKKLQLGAETLAKNGLLSDQQRTSFLRTTQALTQAFDDGQHNVTQTPQGVKPIDKLRNIPRASSLRNPLQEYPKLIVGTDLKEPLNQRTSDGVLRSSISNTRWIGDNTFHLGTRTDVNPNLTPKTDQRTLVWRDSNLQHVINAEQPAMYQKGDPRKNLLELLTENIHEPLKRFVEEHQNLTLV
ncbi:MAG: hypothetical protein ACKO37_09265 [Vampirovibrionales bacterium]